MYVLYICTSTVVCMALGTQQNAVLKEKLAHRRVGVNRLSKSNERNWSTGEGRAAFPILFPHPSVISWSRITPRKWPNYWSCALRCHLATYRIYNLCMAGQVDTLPLECILYIMINGTEDCTVQGWMEDSTHSWQRGLWKYIEYNRKGNHT